MSATPKLSSVTRSQTDPSERTGLRKLFKRFTEPANDGSTGESTLGTVTPEWDREMDLAIALSVLCNHVSKDDIPSQHRDGWKWYTSTAHNYSEGTGLSSDKRFWIPSKMTLVGWTKHKREDVRIAAHTVYSWQYPYPRDGLGGYESTAADVSNWTERQSQALHIATLLLRDLSKPKYKGESPSSRPMTPHVIITGDEGDNELAVTMDDAGPDRSATAKLSARGS